jgi:NAD(P)-dependent dehydrogenase (short-subunit alcohol dehydrogenase family)
MDPRSIVVTGGGRGIGRAIALRLASEGARVSVCGRTASELEETRELCLAAGADRVYASTCDIRDRTAVNDFFAAVAESCGPLHGLVANSGVGGANEPGSDDRWTELVDTNLTGTYWCLRAAQAHMAPGPEARHMLIISSILGRFGVPGYTGYCASKAGLLGLTRAMALELAEHNIQVNALCPGWVDTAMARQGLQGMATAMGTTFEKARSQALSVVPLGRMSAPDDIAGVAAFLLSPAARGITGQGIDVNNGAWM